MAAFATPLLVLVFVAGGVATWLAGTYLSKTTDGLDNRREALGGLILLAITGSLPEIAITASAALAGHLSLAVGNLIGGVAIQTLVLVVLDGATGRERPLSFLVGSLLPVLEASAVEGRNAREHARAASPQAAEPGGAAAVQGREHGARPARVRRRRAGRSGPASRFRPRAT